MKIKLAHIRHPAASGGYVDFAVFDANAKIGAKKSEVLFELTRRARESGLKIDQSALAYEENRKLCFYGDKHLVDFLSKNGVPFWTHSIDV